MFEDKRRQKRVQVSLPIKVRWSDSNGHRFEEVTKSINVSSDGALFPLKIPLTKGTLLELSLPLPRNLQKTAYPKPVYETTGLVVRVEQTKERDGYHIAVRFRAVNVKQYRAES
ncbi:MAG: PilZ domain-containing protein [Terriglobia bacterium]